MMLTAQCVDMSELGNEAIRAIAGDIPEVVAAEQGGSCSKRPAASPRSGAPEANLNLPSGG
jgi:hypothetical protein